MRKVFKKKCSLCYKHTLKISTALIVPLLLAIFTVVITFEQRKENDQQRFEDRELARIHREQDLNTSILTRDADKLAAQLQRENDREIANNQRNMSQILENYRYDQEHIKYLDNLLANYINEIGQLLKENNGSLTSKSAVAALSRKFLDSSKTFYPWYGYPLEKEWKTTTPTNGWTSRFFAGVFWNLVEYNATQENNSTYHIVEYNGTDCSYADWSTWSRGQSWAVHGYTIAYRYTKHQPFLEKAIGAANYVLTHLPTDMVIYWDYYLTQAILRLSKI